MKESIKKRIEAVRRGVVPEGYRRSKDIGIAPADWRVGQLSDVLHNEPRPVAKPKDPYWRLGIRSWAKGTFHAYVDDPSTVDMDELYVVRENDLVVNITFAWEHAVAVASKNDDGLLASHRFPTYVFDEGNVPAYYKAVVSQRYFKDMLEHISPGGAGRNRVLNRKDFLALPCHIPPVAEQQKIAEILATCDRVIELKQQLLEEKRSQKQWLMQKLLDPDSATVFEKRLGDVCTINDCGIDGLSGDNEVFYIDIAAVDNGEIMLPASPIKLQDAPVRARRTFKRGDILMSTVRPYLHAFAYVDFDADNYVASTGFSILRAKNGVSSRLIYQLLFTAEMDKQYGSVLVGSNYPALNTSDVESLVVFIPENYEKQEAVANTLAAADQQIRLLNSEIEAWQQKKKALMQLLLTGLVRVNA